MKKTVLLAQAIVMLIGSGKADMQMPAFSDEDSIQQHEVDYYMSLMDQSASNLMSKMNYYKENIETNARKVSKKYSSPPEWLVKEYVDDGIEDPWEVQTANSTDYQPIIGILTQPIRFKNGSDTEMSYILEANDNYQKWSGSRTIAIPYNIDHRALIDLLGNINGVHLTGGGLELIDKDGNQHPYYTTAKRIMDFSKMVKEKYDQEFPVLGMCQGLEVISVVQGKDDIDTLDNIKAFGLRKVDWVENQRSRFFNKYPESIKNKMEEHKSGLHLHSFAVSFDTYNKTPGLKDEMIIIQQDKLNGVEFIDAMEHKKYPIFAMMYHPEYLVLEDTPTENIKRTDESVKLTDEIAFRTTLAMNRWARKNDFRWTLGEENLIRLAVNRVPVKKTSLFSQYVYQKLDLN